MKIYVICNYTLSVRLVKYTFHKKYIYDVIVSVIYTTVWYLPLFVLKTILPK